MRSNVPVHTSIFILHYGSTESGIQWINKFLWSMEESRKALTSAIFTSTSCVCTPTPSLPIQSISRLFHLFYALHNDVLYTCDLYQYSLCNTTPPYLTLILQRPREYQYSTLLQTVEERLAALYHEGERWCPPHSRAGLSKDSSSQRTDRGNSSRFYPGE